SAQQARALKRMSGRGLPLTNTWKSWLFPLPDRKQEAIGDSCFPHIAISGGRKLPGITGENPDVMRHVVIKAKVGTLGIDRRQAVADEGVAAESLLHSKDGLNAADRAFITA